MGGGLLLRLLQRKGHRKIPAAQRLCPSGEVVDFSQAGVAPGIGAIEQDDLISLIQHNVTGLGRGLRILRGQTLFKRSHLFKAAVSRLNVAATYNLIFNASLMVEEGLGKKKVEEVPCGEICAIMGIEGFEIGDTICDYENPEPLPPIAIDEPTMSMLFTINNSPFFGKDGKYVTSRHIKERLDRELEKNLALRVTPGPSADSFIVYGRGVLHLSVLIETMRREGYELQVGQPHVIIKEIGGKKCEPIEEMTVDCPDEYSGTVIDLVTRRKGTLTNMASDGERTRLEFDIPSRGIIGLRSNMLTATAGEAIMTHRLKDFEPWVGEIEMRTNGSIISGETGTAYAYSIDKLQDRGRFFISPMEQVYEGQVIGEHTRQNDITVNVTKSKQLTNMRASGSDDKAVIVPPKIFTLEEALEYIQDDEYVEVTPHAMRLRKILLNENDRKRAAK